MRKRQINCIIFDLERVLGYYENPQKFNFYEEAEATISYLIDQGFELYYLTNVTPSSGSYFNQTLAKHLKELGFIGGLGSHNRPFSKPDYKFFNLLIGKFKLVPENCLFVDDKKQNTQAAKVIGFFTLIHATKGKSLLGDILGKVV